MISQQIRSGSYKLLWMALPGLVLLLDETGQRDEAREIWAEIGHRLIPMVPAHRADIEARLGPPGRPLLSDDQLVARTQEILRECERASLDIPTAVDALADPHHAREPDALPRAADLP